MIRQSLFKLGLVKPSLNQVSAYHLKTSFSKTRFISWRFVTLSLHTALIYRLNQVYFKLGLNINRVSAYQLAQKLPLSETIGFTLILN